MGSRAISPSELGQKLEGLTPHKFAELRKLWTIVDEKLQQAAAASGDESEFWEELDSTGDYSQIRKGLEMSSAGFARGTNSYFRYSGSNGAPGFWLLFYQRKISMALRRRCPLPTQTTTKPHSNRGRARTKLWWGSAASVSI